MIRPVMEPTNEIISILGVEKGSCMPITGSINNPWGTFYSTMVPTINTYASSFGSIYSTRYTKDNTCINPNSRNFILRSVCIEQTDKPSLTTLALETLVKYNLVNEMDVPAILGFSVPYTYSTDRNNFKNFSYDNDSQNYFNNLDKESTINDNNIIRGKGPNDYNILSPFIAPNKM